MNKLMDEYHQNTAPLITRRDELIRIKRERILTEAERREKLEIESAWFKEGQKLWNKFREGK